MFPETQQQATVARRSIDVGLQKHMQSIYNRMTLGVLVTGVVAALVASSPELMALFLGGPQKWIVFLAPLAITMFGFNPMTMKQSTLQISFLAVSVLYGISFSTLGYAYTGESIAKAFFIATGMFAGLSVFGYVTKKDLSGMSSFLIMGVWGVIVAGVLNAVFFKSAAFVDLLSVLSIIVFSGITAWQTQAMKEMYHPNYGDDANSRLAWQGALTLYVSFIALFMNILQLMGVARE